MDQVYTETWDEEKRISTAGSHYLIYRRSRREEALIKIKLLQRCLSLLITSAKVSGNYHVNYKHSKNWPFDQPRNCATFTMRQVLDKSEPILLVSHDVDDHGWQFIGVSNASVPDARIVLLEEIVKLDPSVLEVADLPPGWQAVRSKIGDSWTRRLHPTNLEDKNRT